MEWSWPASSKLMVAPQTRTNSTVSSVLPSGTYRVCTDPPGSYKGMAANVAHKDAWHRRHQGTRSVDGATVVGQDFVEDPIALGPGGDTAVACPSGQVAPDARTRLGRRGAGTVDHECDRAT